MGYLPFTHYTCFPQFLGLRNWKSNWIWKSGTLSLPISWSSQVLKLTLAYSSHLVTASLLPHPQGILIRDAINQEVFSNQEKALYST